MQGSNSSGGFNCRGGENEELALVKGSQEEELLSLIGGLRRVSGVREVNSTLANGWAESKPKQ